MRVVDGGEPLPRPRLTLSRGELGLLVWGLSLLQRVFNDEDAPDLATWDLERLGRRLNDHAKDLDTWAASGQAVEDDGERPF